MDFIISLSIKTCSRRSQRSLLRNQALISFLCGFVSEWKVVESILATLRQSFPESSLWDKHESIYWHVSICDYYRLLNGCSYKSATTSHTFEAVCNLVPTFCQTFSIYFPNTIEYVDIFYLTFESIRIKETVFECETWIHSFHSF